MRKFSQPGRRNASPLGHANVLVTTMKMMMFKILAIGGGPILSKSTGLEIGTARMMGMMTWVKGGPFARVREGPTTFLLVKNFNRVRRDLSGVTVTTCTSALYTHTRPTSSAASCRGLLAAAARHEARRAS